LFFHADLLKGSIYAKILLYLLLGCAQKWFTGCCYLTIYELCYWC